MKCPSKKSMIRRKLSDINTIIFLGNWHYNFIATWCMNLDKNLKVKFKQIELKALGCHTSV